ncbi:MAG: chemotaxis protein CheW, partial [Myxococcota bacterium]
MTKNTNQEDATRSLLDERARRYAEAPSVPSDEDVVFRVFEVKVGSARLGISSMALTEVRRVSLCLLPNCPTTVLGLFSSRGQIIPAIDVLPLLEDTSSSVEHGGECLVAIVDTERGKVGLRVDEVLGAVSVRKADLSQGIEARGAKLFIAITNDLLGI